MLQGCRLFKWCRNLPAAHCVVVVQAVKAVLELSCWALCCRGAGCLRVVRNYLPGTVCRGAGYVSGVGTYQPGTVCSGAGCLSGVGTYLRGTVLQGCRLFKGKRNTP